MLLKWILRARETQAISEVKVASSLAPIAAITV